MSARRRARAAAAKPPAVEGVPVPAELLDGEHQVWRTTAQYRSFMRARGWSMPAADRLGVAASPYNRRRAAAVGWARENGLSSHVRQLAAWGLVGDGEAPTTFP